ncbi:hypothetical protein M1146_04120, partial [Patescibacteria group bacterium]|nr:hypothetical protein [Patescibacteria group bacterium]
MPKTAKNPAKKTNSPKSSLSKIDSQTTLLNKNRRFLSFLVVFLVLTGGIVLGHRYIVLRDYDNLKNKIIPDAVKKVASGQQLSLKGVDNIKDTNGVYQFDLTLGFGSNSQKYTSYMTHDGKILFISGIKLDEYKAPKAQAQEQAKKLTLNDLKKADTSKLTAFIVSNCPYGLQMQRLFLKTISEQPNISTYLDVKYIGSIVNGKLTSMHGDKEAQENLRQICIREEQKDKYWDYVSCYIKNGQAESCDSAAGIEADKLNSCISDSSRGLKYAQTDFDLANKHGISGSPTLLLNNQQIVSEFDFGGRVANSLKTLVCGGSKTKPDFCSTDLSKD